MRSVPIPILALVGALLLGLAAFVVPLPPALASPPGPGELRQLESSIDELAQKVEAVPWSDVDVGKAAEPFQESATRATQRRFFRVNRSGGNVSLEQLEPKTWPSFGIGNPPPPGDPYHVRLVVDLAPHPAFVLVDGPTWRTASIPSPEPGYYLLGVEETSGVVTWVQGEESEATLTLSGGP